MLDILQWPESDLRVSPPRMHSNDGVGETLMVTQMQIHYLQNPQLYKQSSLHGVVYRMSFTAKLDSESEILIIRLLLRILLHSQSITGTVTTMTPSNNWLYAAPQMQEQGGSSTFSPLLPRSRCVCPPPPIPPGSRGQGWSCVFDSALDTETLALEEERDMPGRSATYLASLRRIYNP